MNFTKTKQLIKTIFLVFIIAIAFTNCETDSDLDKKQIQINKLPYLTAEKNFKEIENNSNLITQLDNIQNNSNDSQDNTSSGAKVVFLSSYNFYVDTDDVNFLENLDGTYHSYTFPIYKLDSDQNNLIQNLLFSFNTENSDYDTFIVTYNLTENERENLANNISVDLDDKVSMEYLRNFNSDIILDPLTVVIDVDQGTVTCWEEEYGSSQGTGWNDIVSWNETTCPWLINSSSNGGNSSGTNTSGGENSSNPSGNGSVSNPSGGNTGSNPSGSTGNSGNANSGGIPQNPTTYSNINTALNQRSKAFYRIQLNQEQRDWLADHQEIKDAIGDFLESQINIDGLNSALTQYPQEDVDMVIETIEVLSLPTLDVGDLLDYETQILRMTNHLRQFGNIEDEIYADYIDSLIPEFHAMSLGEVQDIYLQVKQTCRELTIKYLYAVVTPIVTDLVIPVVSYALFEASANTAIKLLQKIPVSMVLRGARLNKIVLKTTELGTAGYSNSRLIPNSTIAKAETLFASLTKDAISVAPSASNPAVIVAQMGDGLKIILRPNSTTVPTAVRVIEYQNFNSLLGTNSFTLKFIP